MDAKKKIKNKRGTTLIEVILVVALIAIMLLIAAPNVIAEKKQIDMAEMNSNARAVAVAVQSKLYGMKNAGTSETSSFGRLNADAKDGEIITQDGADGPKAEKVKYVWNFDAATDPADSKCIAQGNTLLSGALTDGTLLKNGKILVIYKPDTADVLEVFYSEDEFNVEDLLFLLTSNAPIATYLSQNEIGHYYGTGVDEPARQEGMPLFSARWIWDDELRLEVKMLTNPPDELLDTPLGLDVYLEFPTLQKEGDPDYDPKKTTEEIMIYSEGIFGGGYEVKYVSNLTYSGVTVPYKTIQADKPLTLRDIQSAGGTMDFALDSMVMDHVSESYSINSADGAVQNNLVKPWLRHNIAPDITNVKQDLLYPRESLAHWLDPTQNPYITVWFRRHRNVDSDYNDYEISDVLYEAIKNSVANHQSYTPTKFVGVDERVSLRVELYELDQDKITTGDPNNYNLRVRKTDGRSATITSYRIDPYYYLLTEAGDEVALASMRDLSNLSYVFNGAENNIDKATLYGDITGDQHYEKLYNIRHELIDNYTNNIKNYKGTFPGGDIKDMWIYFMNSESNAVAPMTTTKPFTLSGQKLDGSGSYKIQNINFGGADQTLGGLFKIAKGCTFKYLDIVNAHVWRRSFEVPFDKDSPKNKGSTKDKINQVYAHDWDSSISGSLVGFAVDCEFEHVRNYIDKENTLAVENSAYSNHRETQPYVLTRVSGVVAGGLVGVAVGNNVGNGTTFKNCSASTRVCTEPYFAKQRCLYAGGLIGIAMGNVKIDGCYAASQVSGWYSGGLVGMTLSNAGFDGWVYGTDGVSHAIEVSGEVNCKPKITNSFAAGQIQRTVRVGGGLIAEVQGDVSVTHCYSAVWFETMPPVTYGTFKGDSKNYYVFQTKVSIPLTANVEALFTTDNKSGTNRGDILSKLQNKEAGVYNNGIPATLAGIKKVFGDWGMAETTHIWTWNNNNLSAEGSYDKMKMYPFPMPYGNEFWGDWIKQNYYVEEAGAPEGPDNTAPIEFQGFYSVYYANGDGAVVSLIDAGETIARTEPWWLQSGPPLGGPVPTNMFTIETINGKKEVCLGQNTQVPALDEDGNPIMVWKSKATPISEIRGGQYWANDNYNSGQGVDGATEITTAEWDGTDYFNFYSAKFYDPDFDPIKGYQLQYQLQGDEKIKFGRLYWDYYGFYLCPLPSIEYTNNDSKKYYVEFADRSDLAGGEEDNIINAVLDEGRQKVIVDRETFKAMLGYQTITLPYAMVGPGEDSSYNHGGLSNVTVVWKNGMLNIVENKD